MRATNKGGAEYVRMIECFNNGNDTFDTRMDSWMSLAPRIHKNIKGPAIFRNRTKMEEDHLRAIEAYVITIIAAAFGDYFIAENSDLEYAKLYPGHFGTDLESYIDLVEFHHLCQSLNAKIGKYFRKYAIHLLGKHITMQLEVDPMHRLEIPQYGFQSIECENMYNVPAVNDEYPDDKLIYQFKGWLIISEKNGNADWGRITMKQNKKPLNLTHKIYSLKEGLCSLVVYTREIYSKIIPKYFAPS